jgi:hypothetical protein
MKTKQLLSVIFTCIVPCIVVASTTTIVLIEEPVEFREPLYEGSLDPLITASSIATPPPVLLSERLIVSSLCASASPNVIQSRRNTMGGLIGMTVNKDPDHPEGWYVIPTNGWQWHHVLTSSSFALWRGQTSGLSTSQSTQRGNRMVISATLQYPVSAYRCRIKSSVTNIAPVDFVIGRDTQSGQELQFNINFVGRDYGPDNILQSTYDPETGVWTQRGDDQIFSNGELPSTTIYDDCVRFGATVVVTVGNSTSMDQIKNQFIASIPTLTTELIKSGDIIDTQIVHAEAPRLAIRPGSRLESGQVTEIRMNVVAGQDSVIYHFQSTTDFIGPWNEYEINVIKGDEVSGTVPSFGQTFFRLKAILP